MIQELITNTIKLSIKQNESKINPSEFRMNNSAPTPTQVKIDSLPV